MLANRMRMAGSKLDAYTKSLLHMNGADGSAIFTDEKGKVWTRGSTAIISTARSKFGGASMLLNGTSDYIYTPASEDFNFGSGDFTIDLQIYPIAKKGIIGKYSGSNETTKSFQWFIGGDGTLQFRFYETGGITYHDVLSTPAISLSAWHHIAISRYGNTMYQFVDGVVRGTLDVTGLSVNNSPSTNLQIGNDNLMGMYSGNIDEVRISKGKARWAANFTPPIAEYAA